MIPPYPVLQEETSPTFLCENDTSLYYMSLSVWLLGGSVSPLNFNLKNTGLCLLALLQKLCHGIRFIWGRCNPRGKNRRC